MVDRFVVPTITCAAWLICNSFASAQSSNEVIPLWEAGAPGFEEKKDEPEKAESYWVKNIHNPSITAFLPDKDKATGAAVETFPYSVALDGTVERLRVRARESGNVGAPGTMQAQAVFS